MVCDFLTPQRRDLKCRVLKKQVNQNFILTLFFNKGAEKQHSNGKLIAMIIVSSLLFLYSSAVLTSFVVYKVGSKRFFWFCSFCQSMQF